VFGGGGGVTSIFVMKRAKDKGKPIVELLLKGGNFSACPRRKKSSIDQTTPATRTVRRLWGNGKGRFRTRGRFASATISGTFWLTADRCDGTFVRVRVGRIRVNDIPRRRVVQIPAPRTYLARS
jgi:hypothetical protein